ncbi:hypothetical protein V2E39_17120 [Chryseobacterium arthrosphaerae]|uniref:Uncharacterized protein n=1 Tax=Chryseobacterium arthrosphaerae TaxID=651561 RepID=A0ABU7R2U2_9FLAO
MEKSNFKIEQTVYEVGIDLLTLQANITEQKILCVGEKALFVSGPDTMWHTPNEGTLRFSLKDDFDPSKVLSSNYHTVWTDDKQKADKYAATMNDILKLKSSFSPTV